MPARMVWFMRTYASRTGRQDQPRVRTRDGRPMCDISGKIGHVKKNCYHRLQQNPNCFQPPTIRYINNIQEHEPRITAFENGIPQLISLPMVRTNRMSKLNAYTTLDEAS